MRHYSSKSYDLLVYREFTGELACLYITSTAFLWEACISYVHLNKELSIMLLVINGVSIVNLQ